MRAPLLSGYGLVLIAAILWATMGLFYKGLMAAYALSPLTIVFWRAALAAALLFIALALGPRARLRLLRRDWPLFLAFGGCGVAAFYAVYIPAIDLAGMGVAAVLMYTAPVWVTAFSVAFLGEPLTRWKVLALTLALVGCALVGRLYAFTGERLNWAGILAGLGAGITYGSYILFAKQTAQRHYNPWTAQAYALGLGACCLLPFQSLPELTRVFQTPGLLAWLLLLGLGPTLLGGVAFNAGLQSVSASNAGIVATLEPVLALLFGWWIWGEPLAWLQIAGAGLILLAVVLVQCSKQDVLRT